MTTIERIMSRQVITIYPEASVQTAARLMIEHGVSGLPVINHDGSLVGIVSDGDLVVRLHPRDHRPWWHYFFIRGEQLAREFQKAVGTTVREVMSSPVVTASPALDLASAAALLHHHRIRRLPVIDGRTVVGIVTRADLVRALAMAPVTARGRQPDEFLVRAMTDRLKAEPWVTDPDRVTVVAHDGVLSLSGPASSEAEKAAIETMAKAIDGCQGVENRLEVRAPS